MFVGREKNSVETNAVVAGGTDWLWWRGVDGEVRGMRCLRDKGCRPYSVVDLLLAVAELLLSVGSGARRVRVLMTGEKKEREWFIPIATAIRLENYNHTYRAANYSIDCVNGETLSVSVGLADAWTVEESASVAAVQYAQVSRMIKSEFGFDLLSSPGMTGCFALESALPEKVNSEALDSEVFPDILHRRVTQGRSEVFLPTEVKALYVYDRKFAYAADCRLEMPCGQAEFIPNGAFEPYKPAFYQVIFKVPDNWLHVGLLPVKSDGGWEWPQFGAYETFVAEPELRIAIAQGWEVDVLGKWAFSSGRPLESWRNRLVDLYNTSEPALAKIYRNVLLHTIGALFARTWKRERIVTHSEFMELEGDAVFSAEMLESGMVKLDDELERGKRFYMPHWAAYTWSRARAALVSAMLRVPVEKVLACHVDAIVTSEPVELVTANPPKDSIGQFRLKGELHFPSPERIETKARLFELMRMAEAAKGGVQ